MKILSTEQIRSADAFTIAHEPIDSIDLMERASNAFVETYLNLPVGQSPVTAICGQGNNGGDGFAIARLLAQKNFQVRVLLIKSSQRFSKDCEINLNRWKDLGEVTEITGKAQLEELDLSGVIIDALFGSGISREITGLPAAVIHHINKSNCKVVSVDMPSGLFADEPSPPGAIIEADYTLSFQTPKLAFFLPQNQIYVGEWSVLDIGLDQGFIDSLPCRQFSISTALVGTFKRDQHKFAHKGYFGHALLVAGAYGKMGAAILAARSALRSGLGLLTVHVPGCGNQVLQTAVPEAMCQVDVHEKMCTAVPVSESISTIGIGPGIGTAEETVKALSKILEKEKRPTVIDADGLNILSQHRACLELLPPNSILTPHPKEFQRLAGEVTDDYQRLEVQRAFARRHQAVVVYKGAHTTIALPNGELFFNTTGNPGMATGGSGDVLTGIILGLLARTGDPILAAVVGVYLHGLAGDLAALEFSTTAMIAGDIITHIGAAIKKANILL